MSQAQLAGTAANLSLKAADTASFTVSDSSCSAPAAATQLVASEPGATNGLAVTGHYQVCAPTVTSVATP